MNEKLVRWSMFGVAGAVLGVAMAAEGTQLLRSVTDQAVIVDEAGRARILMRFESVESLRDEWIASATLHLPLSGDLVEPVDVQIDVPKTPWTDVATWNSPWFEPGGDPYNEQAVDWTFEAGRGSGSVSIDVTGLVRSMQSGEVPGNGFLIRPTNDRVGFTTTEMRALEGATTAPVLEIEYRKLSAYYRAGSAEVLERKRTGSFD